MPYQDGEEQACADEDKEQGKMAAVQMHRPEI
jgi:hypothetical protein